MKFRWKNHEKSPVQRTFCAGERWKEAFCSGFAVSAGHPDKFPYLRQLKFTFAVEQIS